jgi:hypothetical protein
MTFSILARRAGLRMLGLAGVAVVVVSTYAVSANAAAGHAGHPARPAAPGRTSTAAASANSIVGEWHDQYGTIVITQTAPKTYTDTSVTAVKLIGGSTCEISAGNSQGTITGKGPTYSGWLTTYDSTGTSQCAIAGVANISLTLSGNQLKESSEVWTRVKLAVTTGSLPSAKLRRSYEKTLGATGGGYPYYVWSVAGGSLPKGLKLNAVTGVISGTPTKAGTATVTIAVSSLGEASRPAPAGTATKRLTLRVAS